MKNAAAKPFLPLGCFLMYLSVFMRLSHPAPAVGHHAATAPKPAAGSAPSTPLVSPATTRHSMVNDSLSWYFGQFGYNLALPVVPSLPSRPGA